MYFDYGSFIAAKWRLQCLTRSELMKMTGLKMILVRQYELVSVRKELEMGIHAQKVH